MEEVKTSPRCRKTWCLHQSLTTHGRSLPKEFRKHFEEACKELNIELFVLPPYSPKYNGRIERSNRTIREEFYYKNKDLECCYRLGEIDEKLQEYIYKYNHYRPHQALDFKTPMEYFKENCIKNEGEFSQMLWTSTYW